LEKMAGVRGTALFLSKSTSAAGSQADADSHC
jgi:hypothetical protein